MRLSKLYANKPQIFGPIVFGAGLNVIVGEIRLPENRKRDTHNLGKTTVGRLLDFSLLKGKDPRFFLFKHSDKFEDFVFFLELALEGGGFLTIRRSVEAASKASFKKHDTANQDFSALQEGEWDHWDVPFERAKELLDSLLDWRAVKPWSYRQALGYLLRSQDDYQDVFQLKKFASAHVDWKPFLTHMLGFDGLLVESHYRKEEEVAKKTEAAQIVRQELGGSSDDAGKIDGLLLLKRDEVDRKQKELDAFDFRAQDKAESVQLVDSVDAEIAELNAKRYTVTYNLRKIATSLEDDQLLFSAKDAETLFGEAGVLFQGQIKREFSELVAFNKAITDERRMYLKEEQKELRAEAKDIEARLTSLGQRRSELLGHLSETDVFGRYRQVSNELVTLRADITSLERQRDALQRLDGLRTEIRALSAVEQELQAAVESDVKARHAPDSLFSRIRLYFSEIVQEVIDRKALLSVSVNKEGHLEFRAEILDEAGNASSAGSGHSYQKLLCIAFDLAVLRAYLPERFPRFVFHDGVFESLDNRKKKNLIAVIRRYTAMGIQSVITLIDSELLPANDESLFVEGDIALVLHDEGMAGRLFRMSTW